MYKKIQRNTTMYGKILSDRHVEIIVKLTNYGPARRDHKHIGVVDSSYKKVQIHELKKKTKVFVEHFVRRKAMHVCHVQAIVANGPPRDF